MSIATSGLRRIDHAALVLVGVAILGAGTKFAGINPLLEAAGTILLTWLVFDGGWNRAQSALATLVGITAVLIAVQIVPLPHSWWAMLPGRELPAKIMALVGEDPAAGKGWLAISLAPRRTLQALPMLLPVAALTIWGAGAPPVAARWLARLIVALAVLSGMVGLLQFAGLDAYPRRTAHAGYATGFFTNRNHLGTLLAIAIALVPLAAPWPDPARWTARQRTLVTLGAIMLFLLGLATVSRAGLVLCALAALVMMLWSSRQARGTSAPLRTVPTMFAWLSIVIGLTLLFVPSLPIVGRITDSADDYRTVIWNNTQIALVQYWPFGSGIGTFTAVYNGVEDLDRMNAGFANEAHNEYLQILLEGGLGLGLLLAVILAIFLAGLVRVRPAAELMTAYRASALAIIIVLLHALVDYPVRSYALLLPVVAISGIFGQCCRGMFGHNRMRELV